VEYISVNGVAIPVGTEQTAESLVALSSAVTDVDIDAEDMAGNPAETYRMTFTKTE